MLSSELGGRSAVAVVVDRVGTGYLGPYGNTWIGTPVFNQLATEAVILENMLADTLRIRDVYRSYWAGVHAIQSERTEPREGLPEQLSNAGVQTVLITDCDEVAEHPLAVGFDRRICLPGSVELAAAKSPGEAGIGRVFAAAAQWMNAAEPPYFLWIHAAAMNAAWDAPPRFRRRFADEEDPDPPDFVHPPDVRLSADFDPDRLFGYTQAYAGEIVQLDLCLGALLEPVLGRARAELPLLAMTSPRGFPLGEHGGVGCCGDRLFAETLRVPLLLRFPDQAAASQRRDFLAQPPDLCATFRDWFGCNIGTSRLHQSLIDIAQPESDHLRDFAVATDHGHRAIRTPIWFLSQDEQRQSSLYVKPDDLWEVNEVADRCHDIVEQLADFLDQFEEAIASGKLDDLPALAPELVHEFE